MQACQVMVHGAHRDHPGHQEVAVPRPDVGLQAEVVGWHLRARLLLQHGLDAASVLLSARKEQLLRGRMQLTNQS